MLKLTNTISYYTDLSFENQTAECQEYINKFIQDNQPVFNWDKSNRPFEYVYLADSFEIVKTQVWNTPAPSCGIEKEVITVRERISYVVS